MKFDKFKAEFEEKLRLERLYDVKELSEGQTLGLPNGTNIAIDDNTKGYLIERPENTKYEVYLIKKVVVKPIIWVFKRSGEYIDNKEFNDIDEALKWMRESYIRDAEIKLNIKQN